MIKNSNKLKFNNNQFKIIAHKLIIYKQNLISFNMILLIKKQCKLGKKKLIILNKLLMKLTTKTFSIEKLYPKKILKINNF